MWEHRALYSQPSCLLRCHPSALEAAGLCEGDPRPFVPSRGSRGHTGKHEMPGGGRAPGKRCSSRVTRTNKPSWCLLPLWEPGSAPFAGDVRGRVTNLGPRMASEPPPLRCADRASLGKGKGENPCQAQLWPHIVLGSPLIVLGSPLIVLGSPLIVLGSPHTATSGCPCPSFSSSGDTETLFPRIR